MNQESSTQEVLEAVQMLSTHIDGQFKHVDEQFKHVDEQFKHVDEQFKHVDEQFKDLRAKMVTKDYLDEKLADLRGDLVVLIRKEDRKLLELVAILKEKQVLNSDEVKRVLAFEPFPSLSL